MPSGILTATRSFSQSNSMYKLALSLITAVLLFPLWMGEYVPLVDLPFHVARADVLMRYNEVPYFQETFVRTLGIMPNLALDLIVPLICLTGVPLLTAFQIFLSLSVLLFAAGCHRLALVIGGGTPWIAIPAAFLNYNAIFLYGYVNYHLALGVYLLGFASWLRIRHQWTLSRMLWISLTVTLVYVFHMAGFGLFVVSIGFLTALDWQQRRVKIPAALLSVLPLAPAICLHLTRTVRGSGDHAPVTWAGWGKRAAQLSSPLLGYDWTVFLIVAVLLATAAVLVLWRTSWSIRWPTFLLASLFFFLFFAFPTEIFNASDAYARFLLPAVLLVLFSVSVTLSPQRRRAAAILVAAALTIRMGDVIIQWQRADAELRDYAGILGKVEPESSIFPVYWPDADLQINKRQRHFQHAPSYAGPLRNAYVAGVPLILGQQPLVERNGSRWRDITPHTPPASVNWDTLFAGFDYVSAFRVTGRAEAEIAARADVVGRSGPMTLYRLHRRPAR